MKNWNNILVDPNTTILATIEVIDKAGLRTALVVDQNQCLQGIVTDGDIRRCILKKTDLQEPVHKIMNQQPVVGFEQESRAEMLAKVQKLGLLHLPIIDNTKRLVGFETLDSLLTPVPRNNLVVVMAGGMGKRLYPLTVDCPKPMLKVGNKPVLEILINNFIKNGFRHFCFAVNYKSEMIKEHFGNGEQWGTSINYLEEEKRMGTAGALSLLKTLPEDNFFVINADVITTIDFQSLLKYHEDMGAEATMCIRQQEHMIMYGVVDRDHDTQLLKNIVEKPVNQFFVNAGVYILKPSLLYLLQAESYCDMPDFLMTCLQQQHKVATFPIKEYWLDIGQHQDLQRAHEDYEKVAFEC